MLWFLLIGNLSILHLHARALQTASQGGSPPRLPWPQLAGSQYPCDSLMLFAVLLAENLHFLVGFLWLGSHAALAGSFPWSSCTRLSAVGGPAELKQDSACWSLCAPWTIKSRYAVGPGIFSVWSELGPMARSSLTTKGLSSPWCLCLKPSALPPALSANAVRYHVGSVLARSVAERGFLGNYKIRVL